MEYSRTKNSLRNASFSAIFSIIYTIVSFICRTIFIRTLGVEYLGVHSLFFNVITVLSFAELGIGNAIIFSLYLPVARNDQEKIKTLMNFYKNAYRYIAAVVGGLGILIIPFMHFIIKDAPHIKESIILIYLLFLLNTVLSYFFSYKSSIITANQKNYIVTSCTVFFSILQNVIQIIILLRTHNYILYLCTQVACTAAGNILVAKKADSLYPYIKGKDHENLPKEEKKTIFENVKALFLYKFGSVALNGTDNIFISALIGISAVGYSSNYTTIFNTLSSLLNQVLSAITASIGNLNAIDNADRQESVFYEFFLAAAWIYGYVSIGLMLFANPLVGLWLGKEYILPESILFSLVLSFYITGIQLPSYTYRTTMGIFTQGRYAIVVAAVINIFFSIILAKPFGMMGIFLATSIAKGLTICWVEPYYVFKLRFRRSALPYAVRYFAYTFIIFLIYFGMKCVIGLIPSTGWAGLFIKCVVYTILSNAVLLLFAHRTKEFTGLYGRMIKIIGK